MLHLVLMGDWNRNQYGVLSTSDGDKYTKPASQFPMTESEKEDSAPPNLFTESETKNRGNPKFSPGILYWFQDTLVTSELFIVRPDVY